MVKHQAKRWPRRLLVSANLLVLAMLALGASAYGYVQWRFNQVKRVSVPALTRPAKPSAPMTILLVGSDTRSLGKGGSSSFGNAQDVTGQRSDTIVLVRVVPATSSLAILSIPRDLLVQVPGIGLTRINSAFNTGPDLLVKTIQQDLGIEVNHFAIVNFATFSDIASAIGGVYQYFPTPAKDVWSNLVVPNAGCVLLKGSQALAFVRSREYEYYLNGSWHYQMVPESDLARIERQQAFIKLVLKKAEQVAPTNPLALNQVLAGITGSVTVDSSLSTSQMISLALDMRHANVGGAPNWTYPTVNSTSVPGALDGVPSLDQQVINAFLSHGVPKVKEASTAKVVAPLAPAKVDVKVLNGSGQSGQAGQVAKVLAAKGFNVVSTGDAASFGYSTNVIEYGAAGLSAAEALQEKLGSASTLKSTPGLPGDEVVLVTGTDYGSATTTAALGRHVTGLAHATLTVSIVAAIAGQTPGAGITTPVADIQPSSSSYYHGKYVPPGLMPGQVPQSCPS